MAQTTTPRLEGAGKTKAERQVARQRIERVVLPVLAFVLVLAIWWFGYTATRFVPSPLEVLDSVPHFIETADIWSNTVASFRRVLIGLAIAFVIGIATALLMVARPAWSHFLETYVIIAFGIPSLAAALFTLMIFGLSERGVYAAVAVITYPFITVAIRSGAQQVDPKLKQMAQVYGLTFVQRQRHIVFPTIAPYFYAAVRNMHALGWKIAIVAEVFVARDGIGGRFSTAFANFNLEDVILWLGVFLIVLFGVEYLVLKPIERRIYRWRPTG